MSSKKKCKECGEIIKNKINIFCNSSCAAKYNNKKYPKRIKIVKDCLNCGEEITNKNKFCNIICFHEFKLKNITLPLFYDGKIAKNSTIRKLLINLIGENCDICGMGNTWNGKSIILEVDHIDGDSDNNLPNNVRLLCPNCHSQTETSCGTHKLKNSKRSKYFKNYRKNKKINGVIV